jgi:hypothetical protein
MKTVSSRTSVSLSAKWSWLFVFLPVFKIDNEGNAMCPDSGHETSQVPPPTSPISRPMKRPMRGRVTWGLWLRLKISNMAVWMGEHNKPQEFDGIWDIILLLVTQYPIPSPLFFLSYVQNIYTYPDYMALKCIKWLVCHIHSSQVSNGLSIQSFVEVFGVSHWMKRLRAMICCEIL